ncbi:hypothetical protein [Spongiactinospora sp. 9N601]|uniref:hypothetical protein n=1 Tax=Spongiactinospora sp. 9N601 TaxID=3375149 RepID=UPI0037B32925
MLKLLAVGGIVTTLFSLTPTDGDGGGAAFIQCGGSGGPGCVTEARRWWNGRSAGNSGGKPAPQAEKPRCTTVPAEPPPGAFDSGRWSMIQCPGQPGLLVRDGGAPERDPADGQVTPVMVALMARDRLKLPRPKIVSSPKQDVPQLVRLPIWLSVWPATWQPHSAAADADGITATATATPTTISWDMGDGRTVTCRGPGTRFQPGRHDPNQASPTCGHSYQESSATVPGGRYRVTATITWAVTWSTAREDGTLPPLTTASTTSFRVAESQAIITAS